MNHLFTIATLLTLLTPASPLPPALYSAPDVYNRLFEKYESSDNPDLIKEKLDALVRQLQGDKRQNAWLLSYAGKVACRSEAKQRALAVKNYLLRKGIQSSRIKTVNAGYREEWSVELWLNMKGLSGPSAGPTLKLNEVRLLARSECKRNYSIH